MTHDRLSGYEKLLGVSIRVFRADDPEGMARTVLGREGSRVDGWLVPISNTAAQGRRQIIEALQRARRPAVFGRSFFVDDGGLAAFQETIDAPMEIWHDILRQVLDGISPADIPVQRPRRFELTINLATANALGIRVPAGLLRRADRVVAK
jgi:putative ABC transport system substrate-binding protein